MCGHLLAFPGARNAKEVGGGITRRGRRSRARMHATRCVGSDLLRIKLCRMILRGTKLRLRMHWLAVDARSCCAKRLLVFHHAYVNGQDAHVQARQQQDAAYLWLAGGNIVVAVDIVVAVVAVARQTAETTHVTVSKLLHRQHAHGPLCSQGQTGRWDPAWREKDKRTPRANARA